MQYGNSDVKVDAGEVAAGSNAPSNGGSNGARRWAKEFTDWNTEQNRNGRYNILTIHAYSQYASQIPRKVENYRALKGDHGVGVTEFGWAMKPDGGHWKCADSEEDQRHKFNNALDEVRAASFVVHRLVWFSVIDNRKGANAKCPDRPYYDDAVEDKMNTYGLFKRPKNGSLTSFESTTPRLLRTAFRVAQGT